MVYVSSVFFFQAEDGIRDLVRSRGLGDVYKRQIEVGVVVPHDCVERLRELGALGRYFLAQFTLAQPVSYTHLTLPTSDLV